MRKVREILRQKLLLGRPHRGIAKSAGVSAGAVGSAIGRARQAGVGWEEAEKLSDEELEAKLYPSVRHSKARPEPDCAWIHRERHRPGVTLELLHHEYLEGNPDGLRYTMFCERYRSWLGQRGLVMRQVHVAGDKAFVDYSGKRLHVVNPETGERRAVELFVGVLGASNYTYAEATETQRSPDWIGSHVRMLEYYGGVPCALVPDQLKSGVTKACRYEPEAQRTYEEMATHYGTTVLPARPKSPRDKAKVEVAVQIAQRWILARVRNEVFHSLGALNERIRELLVDLNARVMKRYKKTRQELFEAIERATLRTLPETRFEYADWEKTRVNIDYHVRVDDHFYSVPYRLVNQQVEARLTTDTVEILMGRACVAIHRRSYAKGGVTTNKEHMASSHRAHADWTPSRILTWAEEVGAATHKLCTSILEDRPHPEQGYRSCLGILRLANRFGNERLEAASVRALGVGARSYRHVESILKHGLDRVPNETGETTPPALDHENLRGPHYYH